MKNYVQRGIHINVVLAAVAVAGAPGLYGSMFGVHVSGGAIGDTVPLLTEGVAEVSKDTSDVAVGDLLYWDNTAKLITKTSTSNKKVGYATEVAGTAATTVKMKLVATL